MAILEVISIDLWLNVLMPYSRVTLQSFDLYLVVEMTDIAHDCLVLHLLEVLERYDVPIPRRSHVYVCISKSVLDSGDGESLHRCLERAYWVDFSDCDSCALCL